MTSLDFIERAKKAFEDRPDLAKDVELVAQGVVESAGGFGIKDLSEIFTDLDDHYEADYSPGFNYDVGFLVGVAQVLKIEPFDILRLFGTRQLIVVTKCPDPSAEVELLPWTYSVNGFIEWVDEVFLEGYKKDEDAPLPTLEEAIALVEDRGYEVEKRMVRPGDADEEG